MFSQTPNCLEFNLHPCCFSRYYLDIYIRYFIAYCHQLPCPNLLKFLVCNSFIVEVCLLINKYGA